MYPLSCKAKSIYGEWVFGYYAPSITSPTLGDSVDHFVDGTEVNPLSLCVGVPYAKDEHGKQIYLNDIVMLDKILYKVVWDKDRYMFVYKSLVRNQKGDFVVRSFGQGGKVLGNAHEPFFGTKSLRIYGNELIPTGTFGFLLNGKHVDSDNLQLLDSGRFIDFSRYGDMVICGDSFGARCQKFELIFRGDRLPIVVDLGDKNVCC